MPLHEFTFYLSFYQMMDISVILAFIIMNNYVMFVYMFQCSHVFPFFLYRFLGIELLGYMLSFWLTFKKTVKPFSKSHCHFIFLTFEGSRFSSFLSIFSIICHLDYSDCGSRCVFHGLNLHLPNVQWWTPFHVVICHPNTKLSYLFLNRLSSYWFVLYIFWI